VKSKDFKQMNNKEQNAAKLALEFFNRGFNCAESTLLSISQTLDISCHDIPKMASGFGAGMGRYGETCGAVSGAVMAMGFLHGRKDTVDRDSKEKIYEMVKEFVSRFEAEFSCIRCKDLTGCDMLTAEGVQKAKDLNVHGGICSKALTYAAKEAVRILL
jgi:C_GCAxxG_C_C family probable redox protein